MHIKAALLASLAGALTFTTVHAVASHVELDYATYEGTKLGNGITQWLGLRFAATPTGPLRFAAPLDPVRQYGVQDATRFGKLCLETGTTPPNEEHDEDCLFMDIYAPSNATTDSKLPVYFFLQGGGFNSLGNPNHNGSGLIQAAEYDMIVVQINYRVGPYGFLASSEIEKHGAINAGLLDQRKALHWMQKHISAFGGDPGHVVLGGDSAGAQSVCLHVTAYGGKDEGLFHATAAESQSFPPLRTIEESQFGYDNLVIRTGCMNETDTLACLRRLPAADIQAVNILTPFPGAQKNPQFFYGPVLDHGFLTDYTMRAYEKGNFVKVPAIYGDVTNEGTDFVPKNTSSYSDTSTYLQNNFPTISLAQLGRLNELYPVENTPSFPNSGRFWRQGSDAYGELRYNCPGLFLNGVLVQNNVPSWNYRWNVIDPADDAAGLGVRHVVEISAIWGPGNLGPSRAPASYEKNGTNAAIIPITQAYWTSFVRTYDPNTHRRQGSPGWEQWGTEGINGTRLLFQTNMTRTEAVPTEQQESCEYLLGISKDLRQ